jgi:predicted small lipoprotein YifL
MSKYLLVAAVLGLAACGDKTADVPPADTTTVAPAPPVVPADTARRDTTDTTKTARDTTQR